jgi:putative colanic acid biosynthesis glycosyltransferase
MVAQAAIEPRGPLSPPLFSIVTVVLNDAGGLRRTHGSLTAQSCRDFDWIVVDGGSRDGTLEYLLSHQHDLAWWRSGPDRGLYDAMNIGLSVANGDYLIFLNAGDTLPDPGTLERLTQTIGRERGERPDFIYGNALERGTGNRLLTKRARSHRLVWYGMFTHHQAMVYRRALVQGLKFDLAWEIGADYAFTLDTLSKSVRVVRLDAALVLFESGGRSQTLAALGRRDQAEIRRNRLNMSVVSSFLIMIVQYAAISTRRRWPKIFESCRCRRMYE